MGKPPKHQAQRDLFEAASLFPVHPPATMARAQDFNRTLANAMSEAIRESGKSRLTIAILMTESLGYQDGATVTEAMINAYTSAARETHNISVVRMKAFVRATGANWLWDVVLEGDGLTILEGGEAHFARAALLRKQGEELLAQAKAALDEAPSTVRVPRSRR